MQRLLPLLVAFLALAGCRDSLTGPDPGPDPIDTPGDVPLMYVKAPDTITEGETVDVRAEPIAEATRYSWTFSGPGEVGVTTNDPFGRDRILAAVGVAPGPTLVTSRAYDAAGTLLAQGTKAVEILRH